MITWSKFLLTRVGRQMIADCQANAKTLRITNCCLSSHDYSGVDITDLTSLEDIKQTAQVGDVHVDGDEYTFSANFDNTSLATNYELFSFGIYANSGGADILFAVGNADVSEPVPASSTMPWQAIINTSITISNAPTVTVTVDLAANATKEYVQRKITEFNTLLNTATSVVLPDSTDTNWVSENDYYYIRLNNSKFYLGYSGARQCDFERPTKDSNYSTLVEEYKEVFHSITDTISYDGYI